MNTEYVHLRFEALPLCLHCLIRKQKSYLTLANNLHILDMLRYQFWGKKVYNGMRVLKVERGNLHEYLKDMYVRFI